MLFWAGRRSTWFCSCTSATDFSHPKLEWFVFFSPKVEWFVFSPKVGMICCCALLALRSNAKAPDILDNLYRIIRVSLGNNSESYSESYHFFILLACWGDKLKECEILHLPFFCWIFGKYLGYISQIFDNKNKSRNRSGKGSILCKLVYAQPLSWPIYHLWDLWHFFGPNLSTPILKPLDHTSVYISRCMCVVITRGRGR